MGVLGVRGHEPWDGGWGTLTGVATQLACRCDAEGVFLAPPSVQVGTWLSGPAVPVGTGLVSWRGYTGWLVNVVLAAVLGAVGSYFPWACVGAAASVLICFGLFPRVFIHAPACIMIMLMAMSASIFSFC